MTSHLRQLQCNQIFFFPSKMHLLWNVRFFVYRWVVFIMGGTSCSWMRYFLITFSRIWGLTRSLVTMHTVTPKELCFLLILLDLFSCLCNTCFSFMKWNKVGRAVRGEVVNDGSSACNLSFYVWPLGIHQSLFKSLFFFINHILLGFFSHTEEF